MKKKKIIVSVTNDISTDNRVIRTCEFLLKNNFEIIWVGRKLKNSLALPSLPIKFKRFKLLFNKGPLFYTEFNIRLFLFLLFKKSDILLSNDLDTLLANFIISKIKKIPLVYDSHEYFTGQAELENRNLIRKIWEIIEKIIFPHLKIIITVNDSISKIYSEKYNKKIFVIRNIPNVTFKKENNRNNLGLSIDKKIIILQGSGLNFERGGELAVESFKCLDKNFLLIIIGGGQKFKDIIKKVDKLNLQQQVLILPRMPYAKMMQYTVNADLALSLDNPRFLNYKYSLPNKIFDYINAEVPILSTDIVEVKKIITQYNIGKIIYERKAKVLAKEIKEIFSNTDLLNSWKKNIVKAKKELNWTNEEKKFNEVFKDFL